MGGVGVRYGFTAFLRNDFLADRTNGGAYATVLCPYVCRL